MPSRARLYQLAAFALILVYFFAFTYKGLGMGMSADDLMNIQFLHGWGERSFAGLLGHSLLVATPAYRPFGGVVYRTLFAAFGLNPVPYRIFCFALLVVNLGLAYRFFALLARRVDTALFALLVFSFHTCMAALYFETSTVYDLLCFTFGVSALIVYVRTRQAGRPVLGWTLAAFVALYGLALDSKEMAISWTGLIVLYEVVFHFHRRDPRARAVAPAIAAAIMIAYSVVKTAIPSAMSINPLYQPRHSPVYIALQMRHYYELLLWETPLSMVAVGVGLAGLLALALVLRSKPMIFGLLFANLALIPVSVIPGRDGFVWYVPYLGLALYVGTALTLLAEAVPVRRVYAQAALFALTLGALVWVHQKPSRTFTARFEREQRQLQLLQQAAERNLPGLPAGSRVLMAEDTFETVDWHPLFLLRLLYRDPSIWVDRPSQSGAEFDPKDLSVYDAIFYARQQPYRVVKPAAALVGDPTAIELSPAIVGPGDALQLRAAGFPNCPTDVEYHLFDDVLQRNGLARNWCTLDEVGHCSIPIPADAEPERAKITRVRFCHGPWMPTAASFEIRAKK